MWPDSKQPAWPPQLFPSYYLGETYRRPDLFPGKAFPEDRRIVGVFAAYLYGLPGVEFWPDQEFDKNVRVTLSWDCLEFDGDPNDLKVYWLDESTGLWVLVPDPEVDAEQKTVSVYVNHFTRYQWGL